MDCSSVTNSEQGTQKYVPVSSNGICAMTLSSDRHSFAVAEFGPQPTITVLDTQSCRKRRTVGASDGCASKEFVALSFSSDAKYLAAQGGGPDWLLHFYAWEKGKLLATLCTSSDIATSAPVTQVSINPLDETELCAISQGRACLYRYTEGSLRQVNFSGLPQLDYTCHAWLPPIPSRLALGTSAGEIVVLLNGEVIQTLHFGNNIQCIMGLARGFACGGSGGLVQIFERFTEDSPTKDMFKWIRSIPVPDESAVRNITGSASDGIIVIEVEACQLFSFALSEQKSTKVKEPKFHALSQPFHRGAISGLDTCVRKPILVTCGVDLSIRIWNYQQNTCELVKYFSEEPYSVALHPSGLYILVGFADKLRLMNVLMDDLRVFREFPLRGCRECRFSSGGHFFAAAQGNMFQIYSTWTFENVANLKGHNGRVRSLTWAYDDSYLVSSGADGAVYSWNVADMKRENEHILKSTAYSCAVVSRDGKSMWAVGSDKMLKEITESTVTVEIETDQPLTQIVLSNSGRMLFAGITFAPLLLNGLYADTNDM
ncbi:quinon protein alcohol dehydrogenase-like superfamily [Phlyctochytrium arcticum]|nr:quinon protein alcohol dehydrogenase-like superfamily [Phlyctochytrium arcticum]